MSNEPMLKRLATPQQRPDTASEAASEAVADKLLAALGRLEASNRATVDRLSAELAEMQDVVANIRAAILADADASALLDDLDTRTSHMMELLDPAAAASGAAPEAPAEQHPDEPQSLAAPTDEEQALLDALGVHDVVEPAMAGEHHAPQQRAEPDHVPTVSGVVSQLGLTVATSEPPPAASGGTTVAMLEAMVEELAASMPATWRDEPQAEAVAPPPEPPAEPVAAGLAEPASAEAAIAGPAAIEPVSLETAASEPAAVEPEAVAPQAIEPQAIEAPVLETPIAEPVAIEPVAIEPVAIEAAIIVPDAIEPAIVETISAEPIDIEPIAIEPALLAAPPEPVVAEPAAQAETAALAEPAPQPAMPETELLSSLAQMEARPFLLSDIGTAVIFEAKSPADASPAATAPAIAAPTAASSEVSALPETALQAAAPDASFTVDLSAQRDALVIGQAEPQADMDDADLDALLFGDPPEADPAASLLEPATGDAAPPWPEPAVAAPEAPGAVELTGQAIAAEATGPPVQAEQPQAANPQADPAPAVAWDLDIPVPASALARAAEPPEPAEPQPVAPAPVQSLPPQPEPVQPAPPPAAAQQQANTQRVPDPLAPLRALSDEEKIALFE